MEIFQTRCPWYIAGPLLGLLVTGMLAVANRPLGASGGWIDLVGLLRGTTREVKWTIVFVAGVILGGALSAIVTGGWHLTSAYGTYDQRFGTTLASRAMLLAVAGLAMGYGIRTSGGCTSGHGICGTSLGSRASWVSTVVFMVTAVAVANATAWLLGAAR